METTSAKSGQTFVENWIVIHHYRILKYFYFNISYKGKIDSLTPPDFFKFFFDPKQSLHCYVFGKFAWSRNWTAFFTVRCHLLARRFFSELFVRRFPVPLQACKFPGQMLQLGEDSARRSCRFWILCLLWCNEIERCFAARKDIGSLSGFSP